MLNDYWCTKMPFISLQLETLNETMQAFDPSCIILHLCQLFEIFEVKFFLSFIGDANKSTIHLNTCNRFFLLKFIIIAYFQPTTKTECMTSTININKHPEAIYSSKTRFSGKQLKWFNCIYFQGILCHWVIIHATVALIAFPLTSFFST